jgi:hypothetical protein
MLVNKDAQIRDLHSLMRLMTGPYKFLVPNTQEFFFDNIHPHRVMTGPQEFFVPNTRYTIIT